jgi:transposase-like protein
MGIARDTIQCPSCGRRRIVSYRQARRSNTIGGIRCTSCRGHQTRHTDGDLRYWLKAYGNPCPPGTPVRDFIVAGGAPPELINVANMIFPP